MASAEVIFLIVVAADPYITRLLVINTRKNKKTHNLLQIVNRRETALFRADEPTGVNNAVLTVHISSMIAILFYVVSTDLKKVVGTARIMLDISIVSYHVEYIICFSFTVYVIISCIYISCTRYILQKSYY